MPDLILLIAIVAVALLYDFYNGLNDCANAIATSVSTRALTPLQAVGLAAIFNFAGAFISTKVATTIGKGIIDPEQILLVVVLTGVLGAALWTALCSHFGIPISVTHSLIGGLLGAAIVRIGVDSINIKVIIKVVMAMFLSPVAGFLGGMIVLWMVLWIFHRMSTHRAARLFRAGQVLSASTMALSHGMNDAQNAMGIITMALLSYGALSEFAVPTWVIISCAAAMSVGTMVGGWRVIRTMGNRITELSPIQGFSAEASASGVIAVMSQFGMPISTTHVIASGIMGTGTVLSLRKVRWDVVGKIVITWIVTIPGAAIISAVLQVIVDLFRP